MHISQIHSLLAAYKGGTYDFQGISVPYPPGKTKSFKPPPWINSCIRHSMNNCIYNSNEKMLEISIGLVVFNNQYWDRYQNRNK